MTTLPFSLSFLCYQTSDWFAASLRPFLSSAFLFGSKYELHRSLIPSGSSLQHFPLNNTFQQTFVMADCLAILFESRLLIKRFHWFLLFGFSFFKGCGRLDKNINKY